ncbi:MAG: aspartate aminotransferase family protein [Burkholderiaceae bacterium]|jgi:acetylornithine aminotransferase|nr:aspartate aminotransferase family protein [Burkholderiales bacterium]MCZ8108718.1 aspartate aminotransferase family protein [Burkholderiales bacterium]MCZ8338989.1 aspartate aminotransferase family protein [Burkholderiaceae bacterium]
MSAASPVMPTYAPQPVAFERGDGAWLYDTDGRRYLDLLSGIAVNTLGHNHPRLVAAIADQAAKIIHTSNLFEIPLRTALAQRLVDLSGMTNVFFCNSGLEANEAAIKIARKYGHDRGVDLPEIVVYERAFHGRSLATLSATGNEKVQKGFEPLVPGFVRVPLNDIAALERVAADRPNVVAVFLEAIQGEGGIQPARNEYLRAVRALCDRKGWLMMVDEVQCGTGRTGRWFAHQWAGIVPDVMPLAKGLASGIPVGAVVAHGAAAEVFKPGNHGTTFGGNPLAMRAGLTTIEVMEDDGLLENATAMGEVLMGGLRRELAGVDGVVDIRGTGLMIGVELSRPCPQVVGQALKAGLVVNVTADSVVRLLPPLILSREQAELAVASLAPIVRDAAAGRAA